MSLHIRQRLLEGTGSELCRSVRIRRVRGFPCRALALLACVFAVCGVVGVESASAQVGPRANVLLVMGDDHPWPAYGFMAKIARQQPPWDLSNPSVANFVTETAGRSLNQHPDMPAIDKDTPPGCQPLLTCAPDDLDCDRSCDTGTPTLDWLAARGAVFPVGYVTHPLCIPSFHSTQSGLYTTQFGLNGGVYPMIGDFINSAGYITLGHGKIWQHGYEEIGMDVGPVIREEAKRRARLAKSSPDADVRRSAREYEKVASSGDRTKIRARFGLGALAKFFEIYYDPAVFPNVAERPPWFVWYSPRLPHGPFGPGRDYIRESKAEFTGQAMSRGPRYYGNIRLLDVRLHELFKAIQSYGALEQTYIFYQNDNGTLLPDSKRGDGENGYRSVMLASGPTIAPNQLLPQLVHGIDMLPTFMDYVCDGISPLYCLTNSAWVGQSMRPILEPDWTGTSFFPPENNGGFVGRRYVFSPRVPTPRVFVRSFDGYRMERDLTNGTFTLTDVVGDPDEEYEIPRSTLPEVYDRLKDQLENHLPGGLY